jgi:hypothetical protein
MTLFRHPTVPMALGAENFLQWYNNFFRTNGFFINPMDYNWVHAELDDALGSEL